MILPRCIVDFSTHIIRTSHDLTTKGNLVVESPFGSQFSSLVKYKKSRRNF